MSRPTAEKAKKNYKSHNVAKKHGPMGSGRLDVARRRGRAGGRGFMWRSGALRKESGVGGGGGSRAAGSCAAVCG